VRAGRSELSVPASRPEMAQKGLATAADVVFLDLEDSVAPDAKAGARPHVIRAVTELDWGSRPPACRINALDTPFFYRDVIEIAEAAGERLGLVIVPKVDRPEDLHVVDALLSGVERSLGLEVGGTKLEAQIETAAGLTNAEAIARATGRLQALIFGPGDYAASVRMPLENIGMDDEWDALYPGHRMGYAMHRIVVAARAAGIKAVDGPYADFRDLEGLRRSCRLARALGFDGKWCIHPAQVEVVNEVFSPTAEELEWARKVVAAYEEATAAGSGVVSVEGRMIDAANIRMAQTTLDLVRAAGME
jgi:citrate lyase beta subunit